MIVIEVCNFYANFLVQEIQDIVTICSAVDANYFNFSRICNHTSNERERC